MLTVSAGDKLVISFGIPLQRSLSPLIAPVNLLGVWLFGYFMDKMVRVG